MMLHWQRCRHDTFIQFPVAVPSQRYLELDTSTRASVKVSPMDKRRQPKQKAFGRSNASGGAELKKLSLLFDDEFCRYPCSERFCLISSCTGSTGHVASWGGANPNDEGQWRQTKLAFAKRPDTGSCAGTESGCLTTPSPLQLPAQLVVRGASVAYEGLIIASPGA
ncbi:hypothetical protein EJ04DRAFT_54748 [Polyplosphaeria fusca]|uniref:Uncharacterized protein n=1 Tax=Polyplosphaeria fusca TaxID=682080 RepID=A0A9P4QSD4_9PLEO|nr:hypothetical protein EJ04DRAFT_54748 [Polyplosphaeria fusca]